MSDVIFNPADLEAGTYFYVTHDSWSGYVFEKDGIKHLKVIETTEVYSLEGNTQTLRGYITDEEGNPLEAKSTEEVILVNADPNCEHVIVGGYNLSGIRCSKCSGWYCE